MATYYNFLGEDGEVAGVVLTGEGDLLQFSRRGWRSRRGGFSRGFFVTQMFV